MRMAVLHVNSSSADSTSPTMRIARFVADTLRVPLIHNKATALEHVGTLFDVLFVKYGLLKFSDHREQALRIYDHARNIINLENDYTFVPDPRFRPADKTWSTVEGKTHLINWNVLTRLPLGAWRNPPPLRQPHESGILYYGAYREDREPSFRRYFKNALYPVTISTFRGRQRFLETCGPLRIAGAYRDPHWPTKWSTTIYIEDETSHELYCSPATRFYECLQLGLAQLIDGAAVSTLKRAGIQVPDDWIVNSQKEVKLALQDWHTIRELQRKRWMRDYGEQLLKEFWTAMETQINRRPV